MLFSIFLSFNLVSYKYILKKSNYIYSNELKFKSFSSKVLNILSNIKVLKVYLNSVKDKLDYFENPFGISLVKYLIVKYILSFFIFIISYIKNSNFILSIVLFIVVFFLPNILIYFFIKNERLRLIGEISNLTR